MPSRFTVELTLSAQADLDAVHRYLEAHRSIDHVDRVLAELVTRTETLQTLPLRGAVPAEFAAMGRHDYRQLSVPPYRLFYEVIDRMVLVSLTIDGQRDLPEVLARRLLSR